MICFFLRCQKEPHQPAVSYEIWSNKMEFFSDLCFHSYLCLIWRTVELAPPRGWGWWRWSSLPPLLLWGWWELTRWTGSGWGHSHQLQLMGWWLESTKTNSLHSLYVTDLHSFCVNDPCSLFIHFPKWSCWIDFYTDNGIHSIEFQWT